MYYALYIMYYLLPITHYVLCFMFYELYIIYYVLRIMYYVYWCILVYNIHNSAKQTFRATFLTQFILDEV